MRAMHADISMMGLYSFDLKDSLQMAAWCREMKEINVCHNLLISSSKVLLEKLTSL
jgi:hypothetical protein